jgi:hypothetical protein
MKRGGGDDFFLGFPREGTDRLSAHVYSHMEILIGYDSFKVSMSCIFLVLTYAVLVHGVYFISHTLQLPEDQCSGYVQ